MSSEEAKRLCEGLQSADRFQRKTALKNLQQFINCLEDKEDLHEVFTKIHVFTFNTLRDASEEVRECSLDFHEVFLLKKLGINDYYLTYFFPLMVERLGGLELVEESEEVRLKALKLIGKTIDKYCGCDQLKPFLDDCITILQRTVLDSYADIKILSCEVIRLLSKALLQDFHLQAESLVEPVLKTLSHQRFKVRVEGVKCLGVLILHSNYKALDKVVGPLAERLFDQIPSVRLEVYLTASKWLAEYKDRYSFFHKILPLILTGLTDEVPSNRTQCEEKWHDIGRQYLKENESEYKDIIDFLPTENLGCKILVQKNLGKLCGALYRDLHCWQDSVRLKTSQLLCTLVFYAEQGLTQHLQELLTAMYSAARDSHRAVQENILKSSQIIGKQIKFETWNELIAPLFEDEVHFGHLTVLAGLCTESILSQDNLREITSFLAPNSICFSRKKNYQEQLLNCTQILLDKFDETNEETAFNLMKLLITIQALKHEDLNFNFETALKVLSLKVQQNLWLQFTSSLLDLVKEEPESWTLVSENFQIFCTILLESKEAFWSNFKDISLILIASLSEKNDVEMRLKLFFVLSQVFELLSPTEEALDFEVLIKEVFVPALVWHAGCNAEAIRTMSASCLLSLLQTQRDKIIFEENTLVPLIISLVEDASWKSRNLALLLLMEIKNLKHNKKAWNLEDLTRIYPEILKRLDDPTEQVRITSMEALKHIFSLIPEEFESASFSAHHELIIDTLLIHFDDEDKEVQQKILEVLEMVGKFARSQLMKKLDHCRAILRNQTGCNHLQEILSQ